MEKQCENCKQVKPLTEFYFRKETGKYRGNCKKCKPIMSKKEIADRANAETKVCKHCRVEKKASEYQKAGKGKWLQPYCKPCDVIRKQKYKELNIDKVKAAKEKYYLENRELLLARGKAYVNKNKEVVYARRRLYVEKSKDTIRQKSKEYARLNRDKISKKSKEKRAANPEYYKAKAALLRAKRTPEQKAILYEKQRIWRLANKDKIKAQRQKPEVRERTRERNRIYNNAKSATDIEFRILKNLRSRTRFALKKWNTIKSDTTQNLLGCTIPFFKSYFTSLFTDGMTWDLFMDGAIHIDHIKPCIEFDLRNKEEQKKCFNYTNLQPLWELDNLKKGATYIK